LDLIFPHHEAEIAQMESISGKKPFVKYWMHTGFLNINKKKMSKSLGNFSTIREILKKYSAEVLRYFFFSTNYRKPINFSESSLENAKKSYERLKNLCDKLEDDGKDNKKYLEEFEEVMDDDFNSPKAIQVIWKLLRDENAEGKYKSIKKIDEVFDLKLLKNNKAEIPEEIKNLLKKREKARDDKNFKLSDKLREEIKNLGFRVIDRKDVQEIKPNNQV